MNDKPKFTVSELRGYKSIKAFYAYNALILGLKMLPAYIGETYNEFYARINLMERSDQEKIFREGSFFVQLTQDEIEAIISCCNDQNGVPFSRASLNNLNPKDLIDMIVGVSLAIADIKIDMITEDEKKKLAITA